MFPGRDTAEAAAGVAGSLAQQLRVLAQLGNVPLSGVALAQQLLCAQCNVQKARLSEDFYCVEETAVVSAGAASG